MSRTHQRIRKSIQVGNHNRGDLQSEAALLAGMLLNSSNIGAVRDLISDEHFTDPRHKTIFNALQSARDLGLISANGSAQPVDYVIFLNYLTDHGQLQNAGGQSYLDTLVEAANTSADREYHQKRLQRASILRTIDGLTKDAGALDDVTLIQKIRRISDQLEQLDTGQLQPLLDHATNATRFIRQEPREISYILEDLLPSGVVAAIIGQGGVSKSFLFVLLLILMATGRAVGPFKPVRSFRVLALFAEDTEDELHRRVYRQIKQVFPELLGKELSNLHLATILGQARPLMELQNNNPVKSKGFTWLCRTIEGHPGLEVLCLDPKSRIYGLEENSNEHNTAWVAALEELARKYELTIIFSHHAGKANAGILSQHTARGGSALVDACRWVANMRPLDEETAEKFEISARQYVEFDITKNNYAPSSPSSIFFKRGDHGVLKPVNLWSDRFKDLAEILTDNLIDHKYLTRRELLFGSGGKDIRNQLKKSDSVTRSDLKNLIDYCLMEGLLETESRSSEKGPQKKVLKVKFSL